MSKAQVALIVGLVAVLASLLSPLFVEPSDLQTSYSYAPSGSRAFHDLVKEYSPSVKRWHHIPAQLTGVERTLLMLEPMPALLNGQPEYRRQLLDWVRAGNRLVVVPATYQAELVEIGGVKLESPQRVWGSEKGVQALFEDAGLTLNLETRPTSFDGTKAANIRSIDLGETLGGGSLNIDGEPCLKVLDADTRFQTELTVDGEPAMLGAELGSGSLHLLLLPQLFRNKSLAAANHAALALTTVNALGSRLYIDEFFHGLPAASSPFELIVKPPFHFVAIMLLLLSAFVLWSMLPRPYPIREKIPPSRRSKAEHFEAMGNLIANGRESHMVMKRIHAGLLEDMRSALHMPDLPADRIPSFLARFDPEAADLYRQIHGELKRDRPSEPLGQSALLLWGNRASQLRAKVLAHSSASRTWKQQ